MASSPSSASTVTSSIAPSTLASTADATPAQPLPRHRRTSQRCSVGWSVDAVDRCAGAPLLAFAVDPHGAARDTLIAAGTLSWIVVECVDAVNRFAQSPLFRRLIWELLNKCTTALDVGSPDDTLTPDYLHATVTNKLQLVIVAEPCEEDAHIMDCVPATGHIRFDHKLLQHLTTFARPPTGAWSHNMVQLFRALLTVKLLREVGQCHAAGLAHHIRVTCSDLYPDLRVNKCQLFQQRDLGAAMEHSLLGGCSIKTTEVPAAGWAQLPCALFAAAKNARPSELPRLLLWPAIDRLQPEQFTADCAERGMFFITRLLVRIGRGYTRGSHGKRKRLRHSDEDDHVAEESEEESDTSDRDDSDDEDDDHEVPDKNGWPRVKA